MIKRQDVLRIMAEVSRPMESSEIASEALERGLILPESAARRYRRSGNRKVASPDVVPLWRIIQLGARGLLVDSLNHTRKAGLVEAANPEARTRKLWRLTDAGRERLGPPAHENNDPSEWARLAEEQIRRLARSGVEFTTDDLWRVLPKPPEPRAIGGALRAASRKGIIGPTSKYKPSERTTCHGRPVRVWKGVGE